jgi:hypothetical protein
MLYKFLYCNVIVWFYYQDNASLIDNVSVIE